MSDRVYNAVVRKQTKKDHEPIKVANVEANATPGWLIAKPRAPHRVKPMAPMRFQKPTCQPRTVRLGIYYSFSSSAGGFLRTLT